MLDNYQIFFPGKYTDQEAEAIAKAVEKANAPAPADSPFAPKPQTVNYERMKIYNKAWAPLNPLYNDDSYAEKSATNGITAYPCYVSAMGMGPQVPGELGEKARPFGCEVQIPGGNFDTELQYFLPIRPGETYYPKSCGGYIEDCTPEGGAPYRLFRTVGIGELYNRDGQLVCRSIGSQFTGLIRYIDPEKASPPDMSSMKHFSLLRECHTYTDDDYDMIRDLWRKEKIRSGDTLYWEDVNIGDEPAWTCDGPVTAVDLIRYHTDTLFNSNSLRDEILNNKLRPMMPTDQYNMHYNDWAMHFCSLNIPNARPYYYNTTCRNQILRMVTNWMSDAGLVASVSWRLGQEHRGVDDFNHFPEGFCRESWLLKVPYLKAENKYINAHGMVGDLSICKGYVYNKYADETGKYVEMAAWSETIEGLITEECRIVVKLPSREN